MVVKTELCAFSEYRIYPGHGIRYIRKDGQPVLLSTSKCKSMVQQRKKPAKLMWTQSWRRLNKKGKDEGIAKKRSRKAVRITRAIVGASVEDLLKKRLVSKPKVVVSDAALKEVKDRQKAAKKTAALANKGAAGGSNAPKVQKGSAANSRGGSRR